MLDVLDGAFLPCAITGVIGWGIFAVRLRRARAFWIFAGAALFCMVFWRSQPVVYAARYSANLIPVFVLGSAYLLVIWPELVGPRYRRTAYCIRFLLIAALLFGFLVKFYRYNPYKDYVEKTATLIADDSASMDGAVIAIGSQYPFRKSGLPQYNLPEFLMRGVDKKTMVTRAADQFGYQFSRLYIVVSDAPDAIVPSTVDGLTHLGSFRKNRKGKHYLHVYRYINPNPVFGSLEKVQEIAGKSVSGNLIFNGGFEKPFPENPSGNDYYSQIRSGSKREAIPIGALFPENWDIFWTGAYAEGTNARVHLNGKSALSGRFSLYMRGNHPVSILYHRMLPAANYKFRCLIRAVRPGEFGLRLSLRDSQGTFQGMRDLKAVSLPGDGETYRLEANLPREAFRPFSGFYLYLVLEKGEIDIDNVELCPIGQADPQ